MDIEIDGIGTIEVDDSFKDLSIEEQNKAIDEIVGSYNSTTPKKEKKYDWISDVTGTVGSVVGGIGGAVGGSLLGPVGTAGGAIAGSSAGGAAGGALGEYIEGLLPGEEREGYDIASTAIQEGAFGLIPGVGGLLTKGGIRAGSRVLSKLPIIGKFLGTDQVTKEFAKLSTKQKDQVITPLFEKFLKSVPKGAKVKKGFEQQMKDALSKGYGKDVDALFKKYRGKPAFEKAVNDFYTSLVSKGIVKGGVAEQGLKGIVELNRDEGYNQGGVVTGDISNGIEQIRIAAERGDESARNWLKNWIDTKQFRGTDFTTDYLIKLSNIAYGNNYNQGGSVGDSNGAVVKLPSGRNVRVPGGMTEIQVKEFLFEKLPKDGKWDNDIEALGNSLDTSGIGSTIGGALGGLSGAALGFVTSPTLIANPVTLGAAGGAAGSAIGESIEQYLTGKGDAGDIGKSGLLGGAFGLLGGAGGVATKAVAKVVAKNLTKAAKSAKSLRSDISKHNFKKDIHNKMLDEAKTVYKNKTGNSMPSKVEAELNAEISKRIIDLLK